jgi:hypothetical protein
MEDQDLQASQDQMLQMTTSSPDLRTSASNAQLDPKDPLDLLDKRDHQEFPESQAHRDHQEDPAHKDLRDHQDHPETVEATEPPEDQDHPDKSEISQLPLDHPESQAPKDHQDQQERTASQETTDPLDPKDLKEMPDKTELPETQDSPENPVCQERTETKDLATTAHSHELLQDIKSPLLEVDRYRLDTRSGRSCVFISATSATAKPHTSQPLSVFSASFRYTPSSLALHFCSISVYFVIILKFSSFTNNTEWLCSRQIVCRCLHL